jgi:hypothetical protein
MCTLCRFALRQGELSNNDLPLLNTKQFYSLVVLKPPIHPDREQNMTTDAIKSSGQT